MRCSAPRGILRPVRAVRGPSGCVHIMVVSNDALVAGAMSTDMAVWFWLIVYWMRDSLIIANLENV